VEGKAVGRRLATSARGPRLSTVVFQTACV
jgi:hypothetical protein